MLEGTPPSLQIFHIFGKPPARWRPPRKRNKNPVQGIMHPCNSGCTAQPGLRTSTAAPVSRTLPTPCPAFPGAIARPGLFALCPLSSFLLQQQILPSVNLQYSFEGGNHSCGLSKPAACIFPKKPCNNDILSAAALLVYQLLNVLSRTTNKPDNKKENEHV